MTAELYRGRSKTSSFQFEGEMVSGFNAGNRIGTGKRASSERSVAGEKPISDGRQAAVDGQLHPVHEARIV